MPFCGEKTNHVSKGSKMEQNEKMVGLDVGIFT